MASSLHKDDQEEGFEKMLWLNPWAERELFEQ
jgi:hypothetical protein